MRFYGEKTRKYIMAKDSKYYNIEHIFDTRLELQDNYMSNDIYLETEPLNNQITLKMNLLANNIIGDTNEMRYDEFLQYLENEKVKEIHKLNKDFIIRVSVASYNRSGIVTKHDLALPTDYNELFLVQNISVYNDLNYTDSILLSTEANIKIDFPDKLIRDMKTAKSINTISNKKNKEDRIKYILIDKIEAYTTTDERMLQPNISLMNPVDFESYTKNNYFVSDLHPFEGLNEDISVELVKLAEFTKFKPMAVDQDKNIFNLKLKLNISLDNGILVYDFDRVDEIIKANNE